MNTVIPDFGPQGAQLQLVAPLTVPFHYTTLQGASRPSGSILHRGIHGIDLSLVPLLQLIPNKFEGGGHVVSAGQPLHGLQVHPFDHLKAPELVLHGLFFQLA